MSHTLSIALIGFGEAGGILGADLAARPDVTLQCYDLKLDDPQYADAMRHKAREAGVLSADTLAQALDGAELIISAVTAESSLEVAQACSAQLRPGQVFLDINSVSPQTKQHARDAVERSGADYLDVAVMAPVPPARLKVPLLLGGKRADEFAARLNALGLNAKAVSGEVGVASAIKMCRSVMIKGLEALTLECLSTARRHGAEEAVLASLHGSFPHMGWDADLPDYLISRIAEHGARRSAELQEVAKTVEEVGVEPRMCLASATVQRGLVEAMQAQAVTYENLKPFSWRELADALTAPHIHKESRHDRR
ncbi:DUF1932 domain-containing protein [Halomonas shantousis]